jgi:hypothetical protein
MQICVGITFANDFAKPSGNGGSTQDGIDRGCREIGTQRFKQEALKASVEPSKPQAFKFSDSFIFVFSLMEMD